MIAASFDFMTSKSLAASRGLTLKIKKARITTFTIRTYVFHMLGIYVNILCNWLILRQNALYMYLGRSRMCLMLQETMFQVQVLKPCKSVQESSEEVLDFKT